MIATIDFEKTGFKAGEDEVLQVSINDRGSSTKYSKATERSGF